MSALPEPEFQTITSNSIQMRVAVQGRAAMHIRQISGSYSGIMGLPLHETAQLLRAAGLAV